MNEPQEHTPSPVPRTTGTTQDGEVLLRWNWTEHAVWTARMLMALETGVKGNCWFSLIDKVYSAGNLKAALTKVYANRGAAGVDCVTVEQFDRDWEANLNTSRNSCGRERTVLFQSDGRRFPSRAVARRVRWEFPRSATESCRRRSVTSWSRSSNGNSPSTVTAFAPDGVVRTRCAE